MNIIIYTNGDIDWNEYGCHSNNDIFKSAKCREEQKQYCSTTNSDLVTAYNYYCE